MLHSCDVTLCYTVTMSRTRRDSFHNLAQTEAPHIGIMLHRESGLDTLDTVTVGDQSWPLTMLQTRQKYEIGSNFMIKHPSIKAAPHLSGCQMPARTRLTRFCRPGVCVKLKSKLRDFVMDGIKIFLRLWVALFVIRAGQDGVITRNVRALMRDSGIIFSERRWRVIDVQVK